MFGEGEHMLIRILAVLLCGFVVSVSAAINAPVASGARVEPPTFANKVWKVEGSSGIESGMLEVFVSDGTLLYAGNGTPTLGAWRIEGDGLAITEEGITYRADILKSTQNEFWIKIHNPGGTTEVRFVRAISAECKNCTPTMEEHAVHGTVTYRERIALPPEAVVDVWITDVSPLIMIQSIVAETTVPTDGRQVPIPFTLEYDPKRIIVDHTYAVHAAILERGEILFKTENGVHVITKENPTRVDLVLVNALASPGH